MDSGDGVLISIEERKNRIYTALKNQKQPLYYILNENLREIFIENKAKEIMKNIIYDMAELKMLKINGYRFFNNHYDLEKYIKDKKFYRELDA